MYLCISIFSFINFYLNVIHINIQNEFIAPFCLHHEICPEKIILTKEEEIKKFSIFTIQQTKNWLNSEMR